MRISGYMDAVRSGAAKELFESPGHKVDGVHLTEIIEIGDDLLIGYRRDPDATRDEQLSEDSATVGRRSAAEEGQIFLPRMVRDATGMLLVQRWYADRTPLTSYASVDCTLFGLLDKRGGTAIVAELSAPS